MCKSDPRKVFNETLKQIGETNDLVLAVSCDSASGAGMKGFVDNYPDRYVEVGISEQNAVSLCAGLSEVGYIPVLAAITPFITMRAYEQVRNDIGYANKNVKVIGSGAGLAYSTLGSSHEAIEDIALMRTVPNMTILAPGDGYEVQEALRLSIEHNGPVYIRMPRHALHNIDNPTNRNIEIGKSQTIIKGEEVLILTYGTMVNNVKDAANTLSQKGISVHVEEFMTVKPINQQFLIELCSQFKTIITIEEHSKVGGFGSYVAELLCDSNVGGLYFIGIEEGSKVVGPYDEVLDVYGLTGDKLAIQIEEIYINNIRSGGHNYEFC